MNRTLVVGALCAVSIVGLGEVSAGQKSNVPVVVDAVARTMRGAIGSARNSGDNVQRISCGVYTHDGVVPWAICSARTDLNVNASCVTDTQDLVTAIRALDESSYFLVNYDQNGRCTGIELIKGSHYAPKQP